MIKLNDIRFVTHSFPQFTQFGATFGRCNVCALRAYINQYYIEGTGCLWRPPGTSARNWRRRQLYIKSQLHNYQSSLAWKHLLYIQPQPVSRLSKTLGWGGKKIFGRDLLFLTSFRVEAAEDLIGGGAVHSSLLLRVGWVATNNAGEALGRRSGRRGWKYFLCHISEQIRIGCFHKDQTNIQLYKYKGGTWWQRFGLFSM